MRVVLDTNVLISALNFNGNERRVLLMALAGRFEWYLSSFILQEVEQVLWRKFNWSVAATAAALTDLRAAAAMIDPPRLPERIAGGHADNRILECAAAASADYLVTGDRRHLLPLGKHRGAQIVSAAQFLSILSGDASPSDPASSR